MFCLLFVYERSRRTIGVILSVVLDPIVPQVAIQRHSATDESEGVFFVCRDKAQRLTKSLRRLIQCLRHRRTSNPIEHQP